MTQRTDNIDRKRGGIVNLAPMRYKNYIWPHNPRVYEIDFQRKMAVHKVPFGRYVMQNMGMTRRALKGEGEFYGAGAYDEFKKLAAVFYDNSPGILAHPVWQESSAYFVSLSILQEPRENYVKYSFEFWEDYGQHSKTARLISKAGEAAASPGEATEASAAVKQSAVYTVVKGDTLWGVANKYGISLPQLLALNPQIKNPNLIYPGDKITVA